MNCLLYLLSFGPSLIWLFFYLRKDKHPEPNKMVIKVFIFGVLAALFGIFLQLLFTEAISLTGAGLTVMAALNIFVGAGLLEETVKYLAAKSGAFFSKELDEPPDLILYMIIAALGFAAMENMLYLNHEILNAEKLAFFSQYHALMPVRMTLEFLGWRFVSATFLHALASGLFGYFLALSFYYTKKRKLYFLTGLGLAAFCHGLYNWAILTMSSPWNALVPIALLISLSCFVSYGFKKLKRIQSTCQI